MWKKIHPAERERENYVLTVWKRASISFQGTDGFTVFDPNGKMVYRVDNYSRKNPNVVLMDGVGNALLTFKPQMRMHYQWNAYQEDDATNTKVFSMRRKASSAEIFMMRKESPSPSPDFLIEGSFRAPDCKIKSSNGQVVAIMSRKRVNNTTLLLTDDVFTLLIQPAFDPKLVMAFLIILDRITNLPFSPFFCSHFC
ncbi:protein LURP-one-related 12-like [Euphorbia lathyris]|uniref:protein LURP-one-related 12-like n=1 Tax=Euphorbia lathyris TaxID=212925 RepID=UPI0033136F40